MMLIETVKVKLNLHNLEQGPNKGKRKKMLARADHSWLGVARCAFGPIRFQDSLIITISRRK